MRSLALVFSALLAFAASAQAADKMNVGKAVQDVWLYTPLDVGIETGIFAKQGLDIEVSILPGGAKLQQALLSGSIDIGLGGSQAMALTVKGAPTITIAALAGPPAGFSIVVVPDSPIKSIADLKGKSIGFASNGSILDWLQQQLSIQQGWGQHGMQGVATGGSDANTAALVSHQIDAGIQTTEQPASPSGAEHQARILLEHGAAPAPNLYHPNDLRPHTSISASTPSASSASSKAGLVPSPIWSRIKRRAARSPPARSTWMRPSSNAPTIVEECSVSVEGRHVRSERCRRAARLFPSRSAFSIRSRPDDQNPDHPLSARETVSLKPVSMMRMKYVAVALLVLATITSAQAADKVRVGKSVGSLWVPPDIGVEEHFRALYSTSTSRSAALGSGARLQQALASTGIDIGMSAGADHAGRDRARRC